MIVFGTIVKVIAGFYIGCVGEVISIERYTMWFTPIYSVDIECELVGKDRKQFGKAFFGESELKVIEQPKREGVK